MTRVSYLPSGDVFQKTAFLGIDRKKKYRLLICINQKILIYILKVIIFLTTCIRGFFYLVHTVDAIFFLHEKKIATSKRILLDNRSKPCNKS